MKNIDDILDEKGERLQNEYPTYEGDEYLRREDEDDFDTISGRNIDFEW